MADTLKYSEPGVGQQVATDDVAGIHYQRVKVAHGADGAASDVSAASPLPAGGKLWNGAGWEDARGNTEGTLLASAARTATTSSPVQTNPNARGVMVVLDITAAATGGLTLSVLFRDPISGGDDRPHAAFSQLTGAGRRFFLLYPGSTEASNLHGRASIAVPRSWRVQVVHADASSWTYAVSYSLIV